MTTENETGELLVMVPEPVMAKVKGEVIEIRQIKVGQLPKIMRIVAPYFEKLRALKKDAGAEGDVNLLEIICDYTDPVIDTIAVIINKDRAWIEELDLDEMVVLFDAILVTNVDFFIQRVLPSLSKLVTGLGGVVKVPSLTGQMPSN